MEGNRKEPVQSMRRCFESSRVEEELWSLAYERLWPLIRAPLGDPGNHVARRSVSALALKKGA